MSQKLEKLNRRSNLKEEMKAFRSFVIGVLGKDQEGEYKPEFIRKVLKAAREKAIFTFKNKKDFLRHIGRK
jgi:hypothetical protein